MSKEQRRAVALAWESYAKLAARTGADPVALAEADVLGTVVSALECMSKVIINLDLADVDGFDERTIAGAQLKAAEALAAIRPSVITKALAACRKTAAR